MNPLATDWPIKPRSENCHVTQRAFVPGEWFYTLLHREGNGFRREDLSDEAWKIRNENIQPFSFWKAKFEPQPPPAPEPLAKENAEELFRRLIVLPEAPPHACYVLAVMLERKRVLKQVRAENADGRRLLVYEHARNGDVFIVSDPQLHLADLEQVQTEVMQLLQPAAARPDPAIPPDSAPVILSEAKDLSIA